MHLRMDVDFESDFRVKFHAPQLAPMHIPGWDYSSTPELVVSLIAIAAIDDSHVTVFVCYIVVRVTLVFLLKPISISIRPCYLIHPDHYCLTQGISWLCTRRRCTRSHRAPPPSSVCDQTGRHRTSSPRASPHLGRLLPS